MQKSTVKCVAAAKSTCATWHKPSRTKVGVCMCVRVCVCVEGGGGLWTRTSLGTVQIAADHLLCLKVTTRSVLIRRLTHHPHSPSLLTQSLTPVRRPPTFIHALFRASTRYSIVSRSDQRGVSVSSWLIHRHRSESFSLPSRHKFPDSYRFDD